MITVGILGMYPGVGCTHVAIAIATQLKKKNKVAILDKSMGKTDKNPFTLELGKELGYIETGMDGEYFDHKKVSYFIKDIGMAAFSKHFDFLLIDYGTEISNELLRSDYIFLVMDKAEWKRGTRHVYDTIDKLEALVSMEAVTVVVPLANKSTQKEFREFLPDSKIIFPEYEEDVFDKTSKQMDVSFLASERHMSKKIKELQKTKDRADIEKAHLIDELSKKEEELQSSTNKIQDLSDSITSYTNKLSDADAEKQRILAEQEAERQRAEEEKRLLEEKAEAERQRILKEEEEARQLLLAKQEAEKQAMLKAQEEAKAKLLAEQELERQKAEAEKTALVKKQMEERARLQAEEEAKRKALLETEKEKQAKLQAEKEEAERLKAEQEAKLAEELAEKERIAEEKARVEEEKRKEEEARKQLEARQQAIEHAKEVAEAEKLKAEIERKKALEEKKKAEEEKLDAINNRDAYSQKLLDEQKAEQEKALKELEARQEAEKQALLKAQEEAKAKLLEEEQKKQAELLKAQEEEKQKLLEENKKKLAEQEAEKERLLKEAEIEKQKAEEEKQKILESQEAEKQALLKKQEEEKAKLLAEQEEEKARLLEEKEQEQQELLMEQEFATQQILQAKEEEARAERERLLAEKREAEEKAKTVAEEAQKAKTENERLQQRLFIIAHDELTGCLNRRSYKDKLDALQGDYMIIYFDIDNLKGINDKYGHRKGDVAIKDISSTIMNSFPTDSTYRIGGDEFVVVLNLENNNFAVNIDSILQSIRNKLKEITISQQDKIVRSVSYGYALSSEASKPIDVETLADKRMYANKEAKKEKARLKAEQKKAEQIAIATAETPAKPTSDNKQKISNVELVIQSLTKEEISDKNEQNLQNEKPTTPDVVVPPVIDTQTVKTEESTSVNTGKNIKISDIYDVVGIEDTETTNEPVTEPIIETTEPIETVETEIKAEIEAEIEEKIEETTDAYYTEYSAESESEEDETENETENESVIATEIGNADFNGDKYIDNTIVIEEKGKSDETDTIQNESDVDENVTYDVATVLLGTKPLKQEEPNKKYLNAMFFAECTIIYEYKRKHYEVPMWVYATEYVQPPKTVHSIVVIAEDNEYYATYDTNHDITLLGNVHFIVNARFKIVKNEETGQDEGAFVVMVVPRDNNKNLNLIEVERHIHKGVYTPEPEHYGLAFKGYEFYPIRQNLNGVCDCVALDRNLISSGNEEVVFISDGVEDFDDKKHKFEFILEGDVFEVMPQK